MAGEFMEYDDGEETVITDGIDMNGEVIVYGGDQGTIPTVGSDGQNPSDAGYWARTVKDVITQLPSIARDVGTAVGQAQRNIKQAPIVYNQARTQASNGQTLSQWWAYSSTTDKVMIGLAVVGIIVAIRS